MMYTVRFAHMKNKPEWKVGDTIKKGDIVGVMGNTGKSTAAHLHIDCVNGVQKKPYLLCDIAAGKPAPSKEQLDYFIDDELFQHKLEVTSGYDDPEYFALFGKWHKAYDVVPEDRHTTTAHFPIHWNRSKDGKIIYIADEPKGYGNCIYITFEA